MRNFTLSAIILLIGLTSVGQNKDFDLSKYKFPDYKRRSLDLYLQSNGTKASSSVESYNYTTNRNETTEYKSSSSMTNFGLDYEYTNNTRKKQEYIYSYITSNLRFSKVTEGDESKTINNPQFRLKFSIDEKYYLTEDKWFFEIAPMFESRFSAANQKIGSNNTKIRNNTIGAQLGVGGGYGRMEEINDLWQAYYILEELKSNGSLARQLEEKDIFEFATFSSKLKNKRFFDYRLKKIAEMSALDSLLHAKNLIIKTDITYFNTMSDYWNFASIPERSSGNVLSLLVTPTYNRAFTKNVGQTENTITNTNLLAQMKYLWIKPINLYWDRVLGLNFTNQTKMNDNEDTTWEHPKNFLSINGHIGWNYYPNFRTRINTTLAYHVSQYEGELNDLQTKFKKEWSNNIGLDGSVYYYISPQLRIDFTIEANYFDKKPNYEELKRFDFFYFLGLNFAIF